MAQLRYLDDTGQLQTKSIDTDRFVIGRAPTCQAVIDHDMISREHLLIEVEADGRFRIRDLGSRNKTYVNGELTSETLLTPGDVIRVGECVMEFLDDSMSPEKIDLEFLTPDRTEPPNSEWVKLRAPLSLTVAQISQLSQLWGDLPLVARSEDIAQAALGRILLYLQAERGLVALRGQEKMDLRPLVHKALKRAPGGSLTPVSQSFALAPILQGVGGRYPQTTSQLNAKLGYASTALAAPLVFNGDVVGILYVDRPTAKKAFTAADLQYCVAAGAQVGAVLGESTRRLARSAAREGVAWMTTVRRLQSALRAASPSSDTFEVGVKFFPGRSRCGDFCDVVHIDEQRCFGLVVDGGAHGITGLVQANAIRTAVQTTVGASEDTLMDPALFFNELNRMIAASSVRQVLPCTYVGIDMSAGKLVYINAGGMPPLLMVAPGRLVTLDQPSLVLGIDANYYYEAARADLPEIFRVICHTDGLTEATSRAGEALGDRRLHEALLHRDSFNTVEDVVNKIGHAWVTHLAGAQSDDDALALVIGRG
ncbi:MAG: SpoIIE family protein phosphatase [Phycisphaerales bacterium]|nr:MAG: SpoIIE family protein phosphatase [Phycisphaerales bacterium]